MDGRADCFRPAFAGLGEYLPVCSPQHHNLRKWLSNLSILAVSALMVWCMFALIDYVTKRPLATKVFVGIILLTCAGFAVAAAVRVFVVLRECLRDRRMLRSLTLSPTLTRTEIARVFSACLSHYGRLQYVQKLEAAGGFSVRGVACGIPSGCRPWRRWRGWRSAG